MTIAQSLTFADTWGMHGDVGAGWMVLMMAAMVLFWGGIIFGIVWLVRSAAQGGPGPPTVEKERPVEILERRFAEGAISPDDYRARRDVLLHGNGESNGGREEARTTTARAQEGSPS